jgi:hypothetical protein
MPVASLQASTVAPSLLEFPSDGSLLMPEVPDSDDEHAALEDEQQNTSKTRKRKHSTTSQKNSSQSAPAKRSRRTRQGTS